MMDCKRFEEGLAALLAGETDSAGAAASREELDAHAAVCPACAGSADLLAFAKLPARERDAFEMPDDTYWSDFGNRLHGRLRPGKAAAAFPLRRAAAAALIVVGLAAGWLLRSGWDHAVEPAQSAGIDWAQLDEAIRQASPEEREALLNTLLGDDGFGTLPAVGWTDTVDTEEFDEAERARLDAWLEDNEL